jgi:peptidylprolyl isomerase
LGSGGPRYTIPAEIRFPEHFHKRGALAAARSGDDVNPMKASSSCQFYIVTGKVYSRDSLMIYQDMRNKYIENMALEGLAQKHIREINQMKKDGNAKGLYEMQQKLLPQAKKMAEKEGCIKYTPKQIEIYTTIGGTPLLDGNYTVFGEVVSGMEVIDQIANMPTDRNDRPLKDIKILKVEVLNEN